MVAVGERVKYKLEEGRESFYSVGGWIEGEVIAIYSSNEFVLHTTGGQHLCFLSKGEVFLLNEKEPEPEILLDKGGFFSY
jgi:hypothetical protein